MAAVAEEEVAGRLRLLVWAEAAAAVVGRRMRQEAAVAQGHLAEAVEAEAHHWEA